MSAARIRTATAVIAMTALALALSPPSAAGKRKLRPNPANHSSLLGKKLDPNRYDGGGGCRKKPTKGARKLRRWMKRNGRRRVPTGIIRCDGGLHGTGRAVDIGLDARRKGQRRAAMRIINTWRAKDRRGRRNALARRMGIQLIIYNCRWWQAGDRRMKRYSACRGGRRRADPTQGHIDHIHVELTKRAARLKTSFWRSDISGDRVGGGGVAPRKRTRGGGVRPR